MDNGTPAPKAATTADGAAAASGGRATPKATSTPTADAAAADGGPSDVDASDGEIGGSSASNPINPNVAAGDDAAATALAPAATAALAESRAVAQSKESDAQGSADSQVAADAQGMSAAPGVADPVRAAAAHTAPAANLATALVRRSAAVLAAGSDAERPTPSAAADSPASSAAAADASRPAFQLDTSPTAALKVTAALDTPEFGQGVADQVSTMLDAKMSSAIMQVNPPQLGPIEVHIAVQGDHAQVLLLTHSPTTRAALESSSTNLRDMLGAQGFGSVSVDISQRHSQERAAPWRPYDDAPGANSIAPQSAPAGSPTASARISAGALDAYA